MKTAVQLRFEAHEEVRCELLYGEVDQIVSGLRGPIALFRSGEVVAYLLRWAGGPHLYVFRTLPRDRVGETMVPGVRPHVRLLAELRSVGRIVRMRALFAYLEKRGISPSSLDDDFYTRVHGLLAGRLPKHKVLRSLLS